MLDEAFKAYTTEWIEQDYQQCLGCLESREFVKDEVREAQFKRYLPSAPAQAWVAEAVDAEARISHDHHLSTVLDLANLAKEQIAQAHPPGERPLGQCCLVEGCHTNLQG